MNKNNKIKIKGIIGSIIFVIIIISSRIIILDNFSPNIQIAIIIFFAVLMFTSMYYALKYYIYLYH
jgi:hypothetical protein